MYFSKKLLSVLAICLTLVSTSVLAYTYTYDATPEDEVVLGTLTSIFDPVIQTDPEKAASYIPKLEKISMILQAEKPRLSYFFGKVANYITLTLGLSDVEVSEDTQTTPEESEVPTVTTPEICTLSLADMVQGYEKKTELVRSQSELRDAIRESKRYSYQWYEIVVAPGTYNLGNGLMIDTPMTIIRGETGNPDDVQLYGEGMNGSVSHVFWVTASDVMIGDMTIGKVSNHPIQVHGEYDADNFLLHNAIIVDGKEQLLKGSYNASFPDAYSDNGTIQCSRFYYSAGQGVQDYMGGIDIHHAKGWTVQYNSFEDIRTPTLSPAEHAIHFWNNSSDVVVRGNTISDCDRGIGFGLGDSAFDSGMIVNNTITHSELPGGDVGIGLESASNVLVEGNTIMFDNDYANAIEYRFPASVNNVIRNNTTNKAITSRDGGEAEVDGNILK